MIYYNLICPSYTHFTCHNIRIIHPGYKPIINTFSFNVSRSLANRTYGTNERTNDIIYIYIFIYLYYNIYIYIVYILYIYIYHIYIFIYILYIYIYHIYIYIIFIFDDKPIISSIICIPMMLGDFQPCALTVLRTPAAPWWVLRAAARAACWTSSPGERCTTERGKGGPKFRGQKMGAQKMLAQLVYHYK